MQGGDLVDWSGPSWRQVPAIQGKDDKESEDLERVPMTGILRFKRRMKSACSPLPPVCAAVLTRIRKDIA